MVTPIEILDTAIKIGLGALISGLATYWVTKLNHDRTAEKERAQRHRDLLEQVTVQVANFDQITRKHWAVVINWITSPPSPEKMDETTRAELKEIQSEVFDKTKEVINAQARLLLIGETKCYEMLDKYVKSVIVYREDIVSDRKITENDLREYKKRLTLNMEEFLKELSKTYNKLSAA